MNTFRKTLVIICCLFSLLVKSANSEMPIIAYYGVPEYQNNDEAFQTFSNCGFTVSLYAYSSLQSLLKACHLAHQHGIQIIGLCPEVFDNPAATAQVLKDTKGFMGYMIQDEPSVPEMQKLRKNILNIKATDDSHLFYINLLPYYKQEWFVPAAKVNTYQEYLDAAVTLPCQQISFDFYPVTSEGIRETWYDNLEQIRKFSIKTGKPFWGFALSIPHVVYPQPTIAALRLQIYSNLAYGAQAIQYFTYWTLKPTKEYDFHDGPVSLEGKKNKTYYLVQQMNRELKAIAPLFYGAKVLSVHHLGGKLPQGTTRQNTMPLNIKSLKVVGSQGALISQFQKGTHRYLAIVNKSHEKALTIRLKPRNSIPCHLTKTLKEEPMKSSYTVSAGDVLLFMLK